MQNVPFTAQNGGSVRILDEKTVFFLVFHLKPHEIRTLLPFCTENEGIFQKWRFFEHPKTRTVLKKVKA